MSVNQVVHIFGPLSVSIKGSYESLTASQSVSQSKTPDRIFIKLPMKFWCLKDKKVPQPGKNNILGKDPEILSKVVFFGVGKRFIPLMCYFWVYMLHHNCLYDSVKTTCFGKVSFSSYKRKCSRPIRFQNFLNFNISKTT